MMTRALSLLLAGAALAIAQPSPQNIQLAAPGPAPVVAGSAAVSGTPGFQTYVYFVVARYTRGAVYPQIGFTVTTAPGTLDGSNFVTLNWVSTGATTYDVLRTTDGVFPAGATCTCAVSTGVTSPAVNDQSNTLTSYTLPAAALGASASLYLDATSTTLGNSLRVLVDGVQSGQLAGIGLGSNTQMYFNDAGTPTATSGLTWNKSTNLHTVTGDLSVTDTGTLGYSLFGTAPANNAPGSADVLYGSSTAAGTVARRGVTGSAEFTGTSNSAVANLITGVVGFAGSTTGSTGNLTNSGATLVGVRGQVNHRGTGTVALVAGMQSQTAMNSSAGLVTDAPAFLALNPTIQAGASATNVYGVLVQGGGTTVSPTNHYGVRVNTLTSGTNRFAFSSQSDPVQLGGAIIASGTVPGISGCGATGPAGGSFAGTYTSGTTGVCTVVLTFAITAPVGWSCFAVDRTTPADLIGQTATSTTTATLAGTTVSGDVIGYGCVAY